METTKSPAQTPPPEDLLEVRKPTSLLIAQFFLFPLVIIAICVGIFLLFGYLTYDQKTPQEYLSDIRTGSESRRWQSAFELSNVISSDKERLRNTDCVTDLTKGYEGSRTEDPRVRRFLALTMGHLGDKRAVPALLEGLNDSEVENEIYTLWALGSIGDNSAVPVDLMRLQHQDAAVRKVAAYVLGALKDPSAIHDLQVALNDVDHDVRWNAAMALAQLNDAGGAGVLMTLLDHQYLDGLSDLTIEQKTELMVNAVKSLAMLKYDQAKEKIYVLSQNDPMLAVRDASIEALKKY